MQDIVGKIRVVMGVGAPHIIILLAPAAGHLQETGNNQFIAAAAVSGFAQPVVHFRAAVHAEDHIAHFFIAEIHDLIGEEDAVGGDGEAEILIVELFLLPAVGHQLLDHFKIHQRLPAEEIHFQVLTGAGVLDKKIKSPLAHFIGHQGTFALVFSLPGEAVGAAQIAVMGHMKAEGFYNGLALFEIDGHIFKGIFCEKLVLLFQSLDIIKYVLQIFRSHFRISFLNNGFDLLFRGVFIKADYIIGDVVHIVDAAAVHVENNIIAVQLKGMNHSVCSFPGRPWTTLYRLSVKYSGTAAKALKSDCGVHIH